MTGRQLIDVALQVGKLLQKDKKVDAVFGTRTVNPADPTEVTTARYPVLMQYGWGLRNSNEAPDPEEIQVSITDSMCAVIEMRGLNMKVTGCWDNISHAWTNVQCSTPRGNSEDPEELEHILAHVLSDGEWGGSMEPSEEEWEE